MMQQSISLLPIIEEIAKIGCYETDLTTGIWEGSDNFLSLFGLEKKDQYTIEEFQALIHPSDFEWVMIYFRECLQQHKDFNCEYRCLKKDGEVMYVHSQSKVYYHADGTPERILGIKQDVTLSKLNEKRLCQLNENNIKKNEVLSIVAHDLRSPLAQLQGLAQLLKGRSEGEQQDLLVMHADVCKSAQNIIEEIIEIAELEDEAYVLTTTLTNVNELIHRVVKSFVITAKQKNISIKTTFCPECKANVDVKRFARMIDNLLSNAIKFTPDNKSIYINTDTGKDGIIIEIRDEGIGLSQEHLPCLFEKFSKVRRRGTKGEKSHGLGLSIVKKICDLHNGTISVKSLENIGTVFTLNFSKSY